MARQKLTRQQKINLGGGPRFALEPNPRDTYRKWYERLQRAIEERWEADQRKAG